MRNLSRVSRVGESFFKLDGSILPDVCNTKALTTNPHLITDQSPLKYWSVKSHGARARVHTDSKSLKTPDTCRFLGLWGHSPRAVVDKAVVTWCVTGFQFFFCDHSSTRVRRTGLFRNLLNSKNSNNIFTMQKKKKKKKKFKEISKICRITACVHVIWRFSWKIDSN